MTYYLVGRNTSFIKPADSIGQLYPTILCQVNLTIRDRPGHAFCSLSAESHHVTRLKIITKMLQKCIGAYINFITNNKNRILVQISITSLSSDSPLQKEKN